MAEYSPGWNDPPPLSFSQYNQPGGKRTLLNKRVPFPLNQSSVSTQLSSEKPHKEVLNLPSPTVATNSDVVSSSNDCLQNVTAEQSKIDVPEEEILSIVINSFEKVLAENSERYEKKRIDEIHQRISVMKESWDSKISVPVKHKMLKLAQELSKGDAESALKIHCILMVDYLREVKQWMVGVKHIIEMERQKTVSTVESMDTTN